MSVLEKMLEKVFGKDKLHAIEMIATAIHTKTEKAPGHVWADYMFLSACYGSVAGDDQIIQHAVEQIRQGFPNYDPSTRFTWKSIGAEDIVPEDMQEGNTKFDIFRYKAPVIGSMNQFCERHPDFSFEDALGEYFPSTSSMGIKADPGPEEDGKYKINQALDD